MPRKAPAAEPQSQCVRFSFPSDWLGPEAADRIGAFYGAAAEFETRWLDLCDRRSTLLEQARETAYGLLLDSAAEIADERTLLQAACEGLFSQRRQLCEGMLPLAAQAAEAAAASHERTLADLQQAYAARGVDLDAMPAAAINPRAAERQLRFKLENDDAAIASLGKTRRIAAASAEVAAIADAPPHAAPLLTWPQPPAEHERLCGYLGLSDDAPQFQLRLGSAGRFH